MKTKVATLDVYFDPQSPDTSHSGGGNGHYVLEINGGEGEFKITNRKQLQSIMAHELGHFIALITQDSTHSAEKKLFQLLGDTAAVIPGERKAWEIAHKMGIPIDATTEARAIGSYEAGAAAENRKRWGSHSRQQFYRISKDKVHKTVKTCLHVALFIGTVAGCVILSEILHHWRAVTVASVSLASYAAKGVEVLTDVIADRLLPGH